ncbi:hypothetical protein [Xenorhabdus bovienii]|uniref:hypothetical protein n=1 Tax=Xenorhabdus bovienii TaxID=40576 RepID=UPI003DA25195
MAYITKISGSDVIHLIENAGKTIDGNFAIISATHLIEFMELDGNSYLSVVALADDHEVTDITAIHKVHQDKAMELNNIMFGLKVTGYNARYIAGILIGQCMAEQSIEPLHNA